MAAGADWSAATYYMGDEQRRGGALTAPALRAHVASRLGADAAVLQTSTPLPHHMHDRQFRRNLERTKGRTWKSRNDFKISCDS